MNGYYSRWFLVFCAAVGLLAGGCSMYPVSASAPFSERAEWKGIDTLDVETRNGSIEVVCEAQRDDVTIAGERRARGKSYDDALAVAEGIEIEAAPDAARPGVLRVAARCEGIDPDRGPGASFRIAMPRGAALRLSTGNGTVEVRSAAGEVDVRTSNGRVMLTDIEGNVRAETSNGAVFARNVTGDVDLRSSNGRIELVGVGKAHVRAATSNGSISAVAVRGNVHLRSSNGRIELQCAELPDPPQVRVVTSNGDVRIEAPAGVRAVLQLNTSNGRIETDLKRATVSRLETQRGMLRAVLNEGGGSIQVETTNGTVVYRAAGE